MSETVYVADSSAILASIFEERGAEVFDLHLKAAMLGTVNLAEIVAKLQERGASEDAIIETLADMKLTIEPFDETQAILAGKLRTSTRIKGLSLGDRACVALAMTAGATVVTTDKALAELDLPVPVMLIR